MDKEVDWWVGWRMTERVKERINERLESSVYMLQIMRHYSMIFHLDYAYNIFMWFWLIFSGLAKGL